MRRNCLVSISVLIAFPMVTAPHKAAAERIYLTFEQAMMGSDLVLTGRIIKAYPVDLSGTSERLPRRYRLRGKTQKADLEIETIFKGDIQDKVISLQQFNKDCIDCATLDFQEVGDDSIWFLTKDEKGVCSQNSSATSDELIAAVEAVGQAASCQTYRW